MRAIKRRSSRSKLRSRAYQRNRAPCSAATPDRADQHVALNRRMCVTDEARQHAKVPAGQLRQRKEKVGFRAARPEGCDTAVAGAEKLARITEPVPERLVRLANVLQMSGQALNEFERGELALYRQHGGSLPLRCTVGISAARPLSISARKREYYRMLGLTPSDPAA